MWWAIAVYYFSRFNRKTDLSSLPLAATAELFSSVPVGSYIYTPELCDLEISFHSALFIMNFLKFSLDFTLKWDRLAFCRKQPDLPEDLLYVFLRNFATYIFCLLVRTFCLLLHLALSFSFWYSSNFSEEISSFYCFSSIFVMKYLSSRYFNSNRVFFFLFSLLFSQPFQKFATLAYFIRQLVSRKYVKRIFRPYQERLSSNFTVISKNS